MGILERLYSTGRSYLFFCRNSASLEEFTHINIKNILKKINKKLKVLLLSNCSSVIGIYFTAHILVSFPCTVNLSYEVCFIVIVIQ